MTVAYGRLPELGHSFQVANVALGWMMKPKESVCKGRKENLHWNSGKTYSLDWKMNKHQ